MGEQSKKWYVVKAISGKEKKAKEYIENEVAHSGLSEFVSRVLIPTEKVFSVRIFAIIPTFGSKLRDCCSNLDSVRNSTVLKRIESQYVAIFQRAKPELPTGGCRVFLSYIRPAV